MNKNWSLWLILSFALLLTSCVEQPEFKGGSNFKMGEFTKDVLKFKTDVKVYNPNNYKINVRPSYLDVYVGEVYLGKAHLPEKFKMEKNSTTSATVPFEVKLEKGILFQAMNLLSKKGVELRLVGNLKVSARGWPTSRKIDETVKLDLDIDPSKFFNL